MSSWIQRLTDHHHAVREARVGERQLVLFDVAELPDPSREAGGLPLLEAWRWFQSQPGTGAAICVASDPDGVDGARARLARWASAHGLRVPLERFHFGPVEEARFGDQRWTWVARVADGAPLSSAPSGLLDLCGVTDLVRPLGTRVPEFSWQGLGSTEDRDAFLGSSVEWADVPLRCGGPTGIEAVLGDPQAPDLGDLLGMLAQVGKGVRLVLTEGGPLVVRLLRMLSLIGFPASQLRVLAGPGMVGLDGLAALRQGLPGASIESAADLLGPLLRSDPAQARALLGRLDALGVDRIVLAAEHPDRPLVASWLAELGVPVDVRDVRSLDDLLEVIQGPVRSVATDFGLLRRPALRRHVDQALGLSPPPVRLRPRPAQAPRRGADERLRTGVGSWARTVPAAGRSTAGL